VLWQRLSAMTSTYCYYTPPHSPSYLLSAQRPLLLHTTTHTTTTSLFTPTISSAHTTVKQLHPLVCHSYCFECHWFWLQYISLTQKGIKTCSTFSLQPFSTSPVPWHLRAPLSSKGKWSMYPCFKRQVADAGQAYLLKRHKMKYHTTHNVIHTIHYLV
jgi:hypothetical protein